MAWKFAEIVVYLPHISVVQWHTSDIIGTDTTISLDYKGQKF